MAAAQRVCACVCVSANVCAKNRKQFSVTSNRDGAETEAEGEGERERDPRQLGKDVVVVVAKDATPSTVASLPSPPP